jgi:membrane protease YdiL (CAAX protease family)
MKTNANMPSDSGHLIAFFILAYALSWSIAVPLALANHDVIPALLPEWMHYLVAFGPMLAALIVTGLHRGRSGLKELGGRMIRWACPKWWIVAFSPLIIGYLVIMMLNTLTGSEIHLSDLGEISYLPPLGAIGALLLWILTFGFGEETGWRGYALPHLQKGRSAFTATMILAMFWALWHLPQFFYQSAPSMAIGWGIGLFAGAVILTWLYNSASNSILIVAIWHGCFNFVTASTVNIGMLPAIMSVLVILGAVIVLLRYKPKYLTSI